MKPRRWAATGEVVTEWLSYKYAEIASGIRNPTPLKQAVSQMPPTPMFLIAAGGELANNQAYYDAVDEPKTLWVRDEPGHQIDALFDQPEEYEQSDSHTPASSSLA